MTVIDGSFKFKLVTFDGEDIYLQFEANDEEIVIPINDWDHIRTVVEQASTKITKLKDKMRKW